MAQNRTLQVIGIAYGETPVTLTAEINGTTVFSGTVPTNNSPLPVPSTSLANASPLFSIADSPLFSTDFAGSYPMTITVAGGYGALFGQIKCNYMQVGNLYGESTIFTTCYSTDTSQDPRTNVVINGTSIQSDPPPAGAWTWLVSSDGSIACDLNVSLGNVAS